MQEACLNDSTGSTALMYACQNGFSYRFSELSRLERGKQNINGYTAMMYASEYGNAEFIPDLIAKECGLKNNQKQTAYQLACNNEIGRLIEQMSYKLNPKLPINPESGGTILHFLSSNQTLTNEHIQKHSQYLKYKDFNGQTALMRAVIHKNTQNIFILLKYEAGMRDHKNMSAYDYQYDIDTNIAQQIEYSVANDLFKGIVDGKYTQTELKAFIDQKNQRNIESGRTSLMLAAEKGEIEVCNWLLDEAGTQSSRGFNALMYAAAENQTQIINLLIEQEKTQVDDEGNSALHYFLKYQNPNAIPDALVKYEAGILNNTDEGIFSILLNKGFLKEIMIYRKTLWSYALQKELILVGINPLIKYLRNKNYQLQLEEKEYDSKSLTNILTSLIIVLNQIFTHEQINDLVKLQVVNQQRKQYLVLFIALLIAAQNPYRNTNIVLLLIKLIKLKVFSINDKISFTFLQNCTNIEKKQINNGLISQQLQSSNILCNYLIDRCYKNEPLNFNNIIKNDTIQNMINRKTETIREIQRIYQSDWSYCCEFELI